MPKLKNHTDQPIVTDTGHEIPAKGSLIVSAATLNTMRKHPFTARHLRAGSLTVSMDMPELKTKITRASIAKASRAELLEIITSRSEWTEADLKPITLDGRDGEDGLRDMAVTLAIGGGE